MLTKSNKLFVSCFYLGFIPFAPGTWGSLFGFLFGIFVHIPLALYWLFLFVVFFISWFLIAQFNDELDPKWIVIDEFLGMLLCLLLIKTFGPYWHMFSLGLAFFFFRLFDIWKPFPISIIDEYLLSKKSTQALGVIIDDLIAGIMAFGAVYFVAPPGLY